MITSLQKNALYGGKKYLTNNSFSKYPNKFSGDKRKSNACLIAAQNRRSTERKQELGTKINVAKKLDIVIYFPGYQLHKSNFILLSLTNLIRHKYPGIKLVHR